MGRAVYPDLALKISCYSDNEKSFEVVPFRWIVEGGASAR
jgi:hypothetical protein